MREGGRHEARDVVREGGRNGRGGRERVAPDAGDKAGLRQAAECRGGKEGRGKKKKGGGAER